MCIDDDTSLDLSLAYVTGQDHIRSNTSWDPICSSQVEPTHFAVEIGSLDAEHPGRISDPSVMVLEDGCDVVTFKSSPGASKSRVDPYGAHAALDSGMCQNVFEPDQAARNQEE